MTCLYCNRPQVSRAWMSKYPCPRYLLLVPTSSHTNVNCVNPTRVGVYCIPWPASYACRLPGYIQHLITSMAIHSENDVINNTYVLSIIPCPWLTLFLNIEIMTILVNTAVIKDIRLTLKTYFFNKISKSLKLTKISLDIKLISFKPHGHNGGAYIISDIVGNLHYFRHNGPPWPSKHIQLPSQNGYWHIGPGDPFTTMDK